jgi:hypothetical protein
VRGWSAGGSEMPSSCIAQGTLHAPFCTASTPASRTQYQHGRSWSHVAAVVGGFAAWNTLPTVPMTGRGCREESRCPPY